jgi:hypothetical protein
MAAIALTIIRRINYLDILRVRCFRLRRRERKIEFFASREKSPKCLPGCGEKSVHNFPLPTVLLRKVTSQLPKKGGEASGKKPEKMFSGGKGGRGPPISVNEYF